MRSGTLTAERLPILVVDDDSALTRTLADILKEHGYAPETAPTGREGLAKAEREIPVLAVVDLRLPDMDGLELAARLHAVSELTEVVVLTEEASLETAVAALRARSVDYLVKPIQIDELLHVASVATERWRRRQVEEQLRESDRRFREALEVRAQQQAAVAKLGQRALAAERLSDLFSEATSLVAETLRLRGCTLVERRQIADESPAGYVLQHGQPQLSERGITVVIPGAVTAQGVLEAHGGPRDFTQDDVHFMQAIAHVLGAAIERDRTEVAFRQAQRLEAVGRLASGVSHDFNNMLTAITGYAEMVKGSLASGDERVGDVDEILKAASRAAGLTRQLLAFSKQQVLEPRLVQLNECVVAIQKMLNKLIREDIELVTSLDPNLGFVRADPGQIEQVILNLCVNAGDAMPQGGTLTVETANLHLDKAQSHEMCVQAGKCVMLAVTDTGTGMDAETRARVFEPFFTTRAAEGGTGLGLATVYGIVKQSGGDIWLSSEVGRGTTFKVFLPEVEGVAESPPVEKPKQSTVRGTETILLAEDEDGIRRVAQRILEKAGYTVLAAKNGTEALGMSREYRGRIDLLLSDVMMPKMSGAELARRLLEDRPATHVLFLSGYADSAVTEKGALAPGAHFLQKPFATATLTGKVREALDTPRAQ